MDILKSKGKRSLYLQNKVCPTPEKMRWEEKGRAKKAAKRRNQRIYRCPCGYYHLTSQQSPILTENEMYRLKFR